MAGIKTSATTKIASLADDDLLPAVDVSASGAAKNGHTTPEDIAAYVAAAIGELPEANWEAGTGTDASLISPASVAAAIEALAPTGLKADGSVAGTAFQEFLGLNFTDPATAVIASGAATITQSLMALDTEAGASTDDLITLTFAATGHFAILYPLSSARTIVLKHGTGNLLIAGGADAALDEAHKWAIAVRVGSYVLVAPFTQPGGGVLVPMTQGEAEAGTGTAATTIAPSVLAAGIAALAPAGPTAKSAESTTSTRSGAALNRRFTAIDTTAAAVDITLQGGTLNMAFWACHTEGGNLARILCDSGVTINGASSALSLTANVTVHLICTGPNEWYTV